MKQGIQLLAAGLFTLLSSSAATAQPATIDEAASLSPASQSREQAGRQTQQRAKQAWA